MLAHAALFFGLAGSGLIFLSFLIHVVKRQDYYKLVSSYTNKYDFPAPYSFYHMVGFFGAFPVIRFFIKLSQKKKMYFLDHSNPAYYFFDDNRLKIHSWMRLFTFLWLTATACLVFFAFFGLLLP